MILKTLGAKWNGLIQCVEDTAVLDASMDVVTSRKSARKHAQRDQYRDISGHSNRRVRA